MQQQYFNFKRDFLEKNAQSQMTPFPSPPHNYLYLSPELCVVFASDDEEIWIAN